MLKLSDYRLVFASVGLVGVLLFASPTLALILQLPKGERFSELWILGPEVMAENYPSNVKGNETYTIYVGIGNNMGESAYYAVFVKFRNQSESPPNATTATPSPLPVLYEYRTTAAAGESWQSKLTFSFPKVAEFEKRCFVESMNVNERSFSVEKLTQWDSNATGYYYQIFFELWIYDTESQAVKYHNRFVSLWLNMTATA